MMLHMTSGREGYKEKGSSKIKNQIIEQINSRFEHEASCDNCKSRIFGARYKCLSCINFDFCSTCMDKYDAENGAHEVGELFDTTLREFHPHTNHVFARIPRPMNRAPAYRNRNSWVHEGVNCSSCSSGKDIIGYRYFCPNCAISICESCEVAGAHRFDHNLIKMVPTHIANDPMWRDLNH